MTNQGNDGKYKTNYEEGRWLGLTGRRGYGTEEGGAACTGTM